MTAISYQFYRKLLLWWSQFFETFASQYKIQSIIWNVQEKQVGILLQKIFNNVAYGNQYSMF